MDSYIMRFNIVFLFNIILFPLTLLAQNQESLFMVPEVEISIPTNALQKNRFAQAVKKGQSVAFQKLCHKLTDSKPIPAISEQEIGTFISKVDVEKEQTTKTLYKASLNYYFSPEIVKNFLSKASITIQENTHQKILMLPVLKTTNGDVKLWEETNAWRQIWANYPHKDKMKFPFIVPYGDFEDINIVSAQDAIEGHKDNLQKLAQKYNCDECVVTLASLDDSDKDKPTLSLSTHYYGTHAFKNLNILINDQPRTMLYQTGLKQILQKIDDDWKPIAPPAPIEEKEIEIRIALYGPADYDLIEKELKKIPFIKKIVLLSMSTEEAYLKLHFQEHDEKLKEELTHLNLVLDLKDGKFELGWKKNFAPSEHPEFS
jgi:hypothetical protein